MDMSFEKTLTVARVKRDITIDEMCAMLGVSKSTYYGWVKSNGASLKASMIKRIANLLGVSADEILQAI